MPRAYSADMRTGVIARVESGASRREAAEQRSVNGGDLGEVLADRPLPCRDLRERFRPLEEHDGVFAGAVEQQDLTRTLER